MKNALVVGLVLLACVPALAATVEYQGTGGNLNVPANWYVITDPAVPASKTGATGLPVAGDYSIIRSASGTVGFSLLGEQLEIGGPQISGTATLPTATVTVPAGGSILLAHGTTNGCGLTVGGYYNGSLNIAGGTLRTGWDPIGADILLGNALNSTGTISLSSGLIDIRDGDPTSPTMTLGSGPGGMGILNISGGSMNLDGGFFPDRTLRLGIGTGSGRLNISGGSLIMSASGDVGATIESNRGTGLVTQTGGFWQCDYRIVIGENNGLGHYKMLGGTFYSPFAGNPNGRGQLWVGRFQANEPTGGWHCRGKFTMNQTAYLDLDGIHMGTAITLPGATDPDHTQMEVKINSLNPFQFRCENSYLNGKLEVSFTDGFQPQVGNEWRLMQFDVSNRGADTELAFTAITPGFAVSKRGKEIWLTCTGVRHAGDANNDGKVNVGDLGILAGNWGQTDIFGKEWAQGDFNGDDVVNVGDLGILAGAWNWIGTPASSTRVPEPASLTLLVLGGLAMLRRRK